MAKMCHDPLQAGSNDPAPKNYPWDGVGPDMVHGITQVGYGGPFVIRSNPFGAIIDTVRGFCFPVAMQADEAGGYDATYDGQDLGTVGTTTDGGGYSVGGLPASFSGPPSPQQVVAMTPGDSQMASPVTGSLIVSPCGPDALDAMAQKLADAAANCDVAGLAYVARLSPICEGVAPAQFRGQWKALSKQAKGLFDKLNKPCKQQQMQMSSHPATVKNTRRLPRLPSPMTLTESNPNLQSFFDPMMGHFDPKML